MLRLGENHFWFALASSDALLYAMGLAASLDWDVHLSEPDVSPLQIQGPHSSDVVAALFGDDILSLKYYWFRELELDGIPLVVTRTGWTAEVGYEVYLRDGSRGSDLWERIMAAGEPFAIRPTGPVDIRRVEGGILNWGADMTTEHNPFEVGLERLCNLDGDFEFQGREALRRIRDEGISRKLVGVEIGGPKLEMNFTKWPVSAGDGAVGKVTTALWSPRLERNIGYAWLPIGQAADGTAVSVTTPDGERDATVVPMPFVDPGQADPQVRSSGRPLALAEGPGGNRLQEAAEIRPNSTDVGCFFAVGPVGWESAQQVPPGRRRLADPAHAAHAEGEQAAAAARTTKKEIVTMTAKVDASEKTNGEGDSERHAGSFRSWAWSGAMSWEFTTR